MNQSFEDRLDVAIDAMLGNLPDKASASPAGEPVDELVRFAADLRANLPVAKPSVAGTRRGREKLLAELDALQRPSGFDLHGLSLLWGTALRRLSAPAGHVRRIAVIAALLVAALALNGALATSADSLPGDPLYDLKRIQERVRLTITVDEIARAGLQQQIDETRVIELNSIRRLMRVARTDLSGTVTGIEGENLVIDRVPFLVDPALFPAVAGVMVGDRVTLGVQTNSDGSLMVVEFRREPRPGPKPAGNSLDRSPLPTSSPVATGVKSATPAAQRVESPTPPPAAAPLATQIDPGSIPAPSPSPTRASGTTQSTPTVDGAGHSTPTPAGSLNGTPTPTELRHLPTPTSDPNATFTPRPTRTPDPSETPDPSGSRTPTSTPTPTGTQLPASTPTPTGTQLPASTPTPTGSRTPTSTPTPTGTQLPTSTPSPTGTQRPTDTPSPTDTRRPTSTPSPTDTRRPTETTQPTRTPQPSETRFVFPSPTQTATPTATP